MTFHRRSLLAAAAVVGQAIFKENRLPSKGSDPFCRRLVATLARASVCRTSVERGYADQYDLTICDTSSQTALIAASQSTIDWKTR